MSGQPSSDTSHPPNLFTQGHLRDPGLESLLPRSVSSMSSTGGNTMPQASTSSLGDSFHTDSRVSLFTSGDASGHTSPPTSSSSDVQRPSFDNNEMDFDSESSDTDTEMADARSNFDGISNSDLDPSGQRVQNQDLAPDDLLKSITNVFRLLDLVDERGSGGVVEKVVIDQTSLHRVLNTVQPGSYDSVSKINFKALDHLSIRPTGIYGNRSEIVKFLCEAQYLDENSAALLSRVNGPNDSNEGLRSGLYLVLDPKHMTLGSSKSAYIIYWPEDTTWDDQAASSSVRRNRVTFMRYLTKLADQIIALVSPSQAKAFVWDTSAHNKDLPEDQQDNDDDSRLFSFEVSKSLEQEEDAVGSPGFTVPVDSRLLPKDKETSRVRLVPGEQKIALLTVKYERAQPQEKAFEENISALNLRRVIGNSADCPLQLGDLKPGDLENLASHGLRDKHRSIFQAHERRLRTLDDDRVASQKEDNKFIEGLITQDKPKVKDEIRNTVRVIYNRTYPALEFGYEVGHEPQVSTELHIRYSGLGKLESEIRKKVKMDHVQDKQYQVLKSKWLLIEEYLDNNPKLSRSEQDDFVNDVLNGAAPRADNKPAPENQSNGGGIGGLVASGVSAVKGLLGRGNSHKDTAPKLDSSPRTNASRELSDPQFVAHIHARKDSLPALSELLRRIQACLGQNVEAIEQKVLLEQLDKILSGERHRQTRARSEARDNIYKLGKEASFEELMVDLKRVMLSDAPTIRHVNWVGSVDRPSYNYYSTSGGQFRWSGTITSLRPAQNRYHVYPLELTEQDSHHCRADESHVPHPKLETRHGFEFTLRKGRSAEFIQLIREKCLVITSETDRTRIYIEDNVTLEQSVNSTPGKVTLNHDSLGGPKCEFALDQATRLLAIVHGQKEDLKLSIYIFDELFTNLRSRGSPIPLKNWYNQPVDIKKICFVSGIEEVCLVETSGRVRVFSLVTQQFR